MNYEIIPGAIIADGKLNDAVYISPYGYYIPLKCTSVATPNKNGYRYIVADDKEFCLHRIIHESGRPRLMNTIKEIIQLISQGD